MVHIIFGIEMFVTRGIVSRIEVVSQWIIITQSLQPGIRGWAIAILIV